MEKYVVSFRNCIRQWLKILVYQIHFIAELDFDALLPKHINAKPISKFQGVYKDLSVVIDKSMNYFEVAKVLNGLES